VFDPYLSSIIASIRAVRVSRSLDGSESFREDCGADCTRAGLNACAALSIAFASPCRTAASRAATARDIVYEVAGALLPSPRCRFAKIARKRPRSTCSVDDESGVSVSAWVALLVEIAKALGEASPGALSEVSECLVWKCSAVCVCWTIPRLLRLRTKCFWQIVQQVAALVVTLLRIHRTRKREYEARSLSLAALNGQSPCIARARCD